MTSTNTAPHRESETTSRHADIREERHADHARTREQVAREDRGHREHVPVCKFIKDNFPLLTANEYFRIVYDYIATLYMDFKNSFIVMYILGWFMLFVPLLNPAFWLARMWYWTVFMLMVKPILAFWKKVGAILGVNAVLQALWRKTLQLIDFCGNYIMNALGSIYQYIKDFWQQIVDDSSNILTQILQQAAETLRTVVRLVKILYGYAKQLSDLILSEKMENLIIWIALACFSVAKWFYHLNKIYQNTCDAAIRIILETWYEPSVEVAPRSFGVVEAPASGGVQSTGTKTATTAHGSSAAGGTSHHETPAAGGSHDEDASRQRKARE